MRHNAPPPFDTQGPRPGEDGPQFFGLVRMWVEAHNFFDPPSKLMFMKCRYAPLPDATGSDTGSYVGDFLWVRQRRPHVRGDEVWITAMTMAVGEYNGKLVYYVELPFGNTCVCRVAENAPAGGKYYGWALGPAATAPTDLSNLTDADVGAEPTDLEIYNALIQNAQEAERGATHWITNAVWMVDSFIGLVTEQFTEDGKWIININGIDQKLCDAS